jgi:predicted DNA-binding protein YlxM (UPF0122 family)
MMEAYMNVIDRIELNGKIIDLKAYYLQCLYNGKKKKGKVYESLEEQVDSEYPSTEESVLDLKEISLKQFYFLMMVVKNTLGTKHYFLFRDLIMNGETIRELAEWYGLSKSAVHRYINSCQKLVSSEMMIELLKKV